MQRFDHESALSAEDRVLGRSVAGEQAISSSAAHENALQVSRRTLNEPASKRKPSETAFNNVSTSAQVTDLLDTLLSDPSLDHAVRFGTIAALMRRAVFYGESFDRASDLQERLFTFTDLLYKSLRTHTDVFSADDMQHAAKFRTALVLAAQEDEGSFTSSAAAYVELQKPRIPTATTSDRALEEPSLAPITSIRQLGDKLMLWSAQKVNEQIKNITLVRQDENAVVRWIAERVSRWSLSEEMATQAAEQQRTAAGTTWTEYIAYAAQTLASSILSDKSVLRDLQELVRTRVEDAWKLREKDRTAGAAHLAAIFDDIEKNFDRFADAFGKGFRMAMHAEIEKTRRNLYFYKGLLYGMYNGVANSKDLLISTCELIVVGAIFSPLTLVDFLAGTVYQLWADIRDLCYGIYWIFTHLEEIAEDILSAIESVKTALGFIASLPYAELVPLIKSATESMGETDLAPYYEEFGSFIGSTLSDGTLRFLFGDAENFDLLKNGFQNNLSIAATYFFNWGAFLGPIIVEIVISIYTGGAGLLAALEKGGSELFLRTSRKLYVLILKMLKKLEKAFDSMAELPAVAEKIKDVVLKNIHNILPMLKKGMKVDAEELKKTFEWLGKLCEPTDIVEFICSILVAVFGPPPDKDPSAHE